MLDVVFWGGFALCGCALWFLAGVELGKRIQDDRHREALARQRRTRRVMAGLKH